jgi:hypothetical protein
MEILKRLSVYDFFVLALLPFLSSLVSLVFHAPYILSIFLFYSLPGIYLILRFGRLWQVAKGAIFTFIISLPFAIIIDYIGTTSGVWYVPYSLFPSRFLGVIPIEDFFWMASGVFTLVVGYEIMLNKGKRELADKHLWYFISIALFVLSAFFLILASGGKHLFVWEGPYTYLILGTVFFALPTLIFLWHFPQFLRRALSLVAYFFALTFFFEITATFLNQWVFTGVYFLPPINFFGFNPIPWEELFFVGFVGPFSVVAFYELFDDDRK